MTDEAKVLGQVRGSIQVDAFPAGREDQQLQLNQQGEQLIAPAASAYGEIIRQGRAFMVRTATAVASVTAIPSTAVALGLYNGEPDSGRSYVIDRVWALFTVNSGAALVHGGIIGVLGQVREAAPTDAGLVIIKLNGLGRSGSANSNADSRALTIIGGTALPAGTGIANAWFPLGPSVASAVNALPGFQQVVPIEGRIIVPPGRYFAVHTLGSVTTMSAQMGIEWHERQLLLG